MVRQFIVVESFQKPRSWPTPQDYNEAVQNLASNVKDNDLRSGTLGVDALGLPRPVSGAFASVYKIHCDGRDFALRCFLRNIADQQERYASISDFVQNDDLLSTVSFDFMAEGISINGVWFPCLKMDWVDGATLEQCVASNLRNPKSIRALAEQFKSMCIELQLAGIAHGDLQHGNIIVTPNGELRLVDYDGMFIPTMKHALSNELGHRNFQHPQRHARHFGAYLDNFSAWVIFASLRMLFIDPSLFRRLNAGDDCLLFRQQDFVQPLQSSTFALMEKHGEREVRNLAKFIRYQLGVDLLDVPPLSDQLPSIGDLAPLQAKDFSRKLALVETRVQKIERKTNHDLLDGAKQDRTIQHKPSAVSGLEPEFYKQSNLPRQVLWARAEDKLAPGALQRFFLNPILWMFLILFFLQPLYSPQSTFWILQGLQSMLSIPLLLLSGAFIVCLQLTLWAKPLRHRWLARWGDVAVAVIDAKLATDMECLIGYTFACKKGCRHTVYAAVSKQDFDNCREGETATILFHPKHIENNWVVYKSCFYRIAETPVDKSLTAPHGGARSAKMLYTFGRNMLRLLREFSPVPVPNPLPVPELELNQAFPRAAVFNERHGLVDAMILQILMLLNPSVWLMIYCWYMTATDHLGAVVVAVALTVLNGVLEFNIWFRTSMEKGLVQYGTAVVGQITLRSAIEEPHNPVSFIIGYDFQTADGFLVEQQVRVSPAEYARVRMGDSVTILYRQDGSDISCQIYKFSHYKAVVETGE